MRGRRYRIVELKFAAQPAAIRHSESLFENDFEP